MFWWLMAQRRARGPEVVYSEAMTAAGVVVLVLVGGTIGGLLVGCAMVAYGVGSAIARTPASPPAQTPSAAPEAVTPGQPGMTERRTRERREKIVIERSWPLAG